MTPRVIAIRNYVFGVDLETKKFVVYDIEHDKICFEHILTNLDIEKLAEFFTNLEKEI